MTPQEALQIKAYIDSLVTAVPQQPSPSLFATPEQQIVTLKDINANVWHDPCVDAALARLGPAPNCPPSDSTHLYCITLLYETGDFLETLKRNIAAMRYIHGDNGVWQWNGIVVSPDGVRLREGVPARPTGLYWAIVELGRATQGQAVEQTRQEQNGMGHEGLLIAALHKQWATAMNGEDIPYLNLPELEVAPVGRGAFSCAACLSWFSIDRQVIFDAGRVGGASPRFGSGSVR